MVTMNPQAAELNGIIKAQNPLTVYRIICLFLLGVTRAPAADPCDRKCLERHVDEVLDAMVNHAPGRLSRVVAQPRKGRPAILHTPRR